MKNNKGITLIALTVMVIVIIIIASVTVYSGINSVKNSKDKKYEAELGTIQHAVLENYSKYLSTKDLPNEGTTNYLVGTKITFADARAVANQIGVVLKANDYDSNPSVDESECYYRLKEADLNKIGIVSTVESDIEADTYIVNYATGEVMNETQATERALYVYAVDLR